MKSKPTIPEISPLIEHWMPDASEEDKRRATVNFRNYLAVAYRIFERLEAEGKLPEPRDKSERYVTVDESKQEEI